MALKFSLSSMKYFKKIISGGLTFLFLLTAIVFLALTIYMSKQTERDVSYVANMYMEIITNQKLNRFEIFKDLRFRQSESLANALINLPNPNSERIASIIEELGQGQDLVSCVLISSTGELEKLSGPQSLKINDLHYTTKSLLEGKRVLSSAETVQGTLVIYGFPCFIPMKSGESSIGILFGRPFERFDTILDLHSNNAPAYFHIIQYDSKYLVRTDDILYEDFFSKLRRCARPTDCTVDDLILALKKAIQENKSFSYHTDFWNPKTNLIERRAFLA
ncbi:MAG: hypothetical protein IK079_04350, partial [Desulfovibrio sp.]|nr:hypothetical protein [Desulfovibrio sp.]